MSGFNFNANEFKRQIEREFQHAADDFGRTLERDLNALSRSQVGKPLADVKNTVQRVFRKNDGNITDPELTEYATAIQAGQQIKVNVQKIRL